MLSVGTAHTAGTADATPAHSLCRATVTSERFRQLSPTNLASASSGCARLHCMRVPLGMRCPDSSKSCGWGGPQERSQHAVLCRASRKAQKDACACNADPGLRCQMWAGRGLPQCRAESVSGQGCPPACLLACLRACMPPARRPPQPPAHPPTHCLPSTWTHREGHPGEPSNDGLDPEHLADHALCNKGEDTGTLPSGGTQAGTLPHAPGPRLRALRAAAVTATATAAAAAGGLPTARQAGGQALRLLATPRAGQPPSR